MQNLGMNKVFATAKVLAASWLCSQYSLAFVANSFVVSRGRGFASRHQNHVVHQSTPTPAALRMAYAPDTVQAAWDNHFSAFGGQDVDKILLDYDDNSQVVTYDHTTGEKTTYKGVEEVRSLFTGLFKVLSDTSDLAAPVIDVSEDSKMVFLVWKCPASGFPTATDTFVFSDNLKIYRDMSSSVPPE